MKIRDLTNELAIELEAAWAAALPCQVDAHRSTDHLAWLLTESDSHWYQLDGHRAWVYITEVQPGLSATLHALNLEGWGAVRPDEVRTLLKEIMTEHSLHRLTVVLPAPVGKLHRATKMIGFTKEGRLRGALIFNGRPTDAVIYGLLRREVEPIVEDDKAAPRRRRRRRRKNKWEHKTQPGSQSSTQRLAVPSNSNHTRPTSKDRRPEFRQDFPMTNTSTNTLEEMVELPPLVQ